MRLPWKFQQASNLDATNVDLAKLKKEANQLAAQTLIEEGMDLARNGNFDKAKGKFQQASNLDATNVDLAKLKKEANQLHAQTLIKEGIYEVRQGNVTKALYLYNQAQNIDPNINIDAKSRATFCWFGSIYRHAQKVLFVCEKAVKLAPDEETKAFSLVSRGLARALTGNTQVAIADFEAFVNSPKFGEEEKKQVKQWIELLEKGENPFTDEVLENLKNE